MKTNQKYVAVSLATMLAVTAMTLGTFSFAQTVTPVGCSIGTASVAPNQAVTLTASGGNGSYTWSGPNLNITNASGNQFAVSYPNLGSYPVTVTSAGQSATCTVNVTAPVSTGSLFCSPAVQTVALGQTASVSASGGNGSYIWSAPDLTISNPTGSGFSASYATTGVKTIYVASAGLVASCSFNVIANSGSTPGLPNTGGGYGR